MADNFCRKLAQLYFVSRMMGTYTYDRSLQIYADILTNGTRQLIMSQTNVSDNLEYLQRVLQIWNEFLTMWISSVFFVTVAAYVSKFLSRGKILSKNEPPPE